MSSDPDGIAPLAGPRLLTAGPGLHPALHAPAHWSACTDRRREAGPVEREEGPIRYSTLLARQNEEARAARRREEPARTHPAVRWAVDEQWLSRSSRAPEPCAGEPAAEGSSAGTRSVAPSPRLGEVSPVTPAAIERRIRVTHRLFLTRVLGRLIDFFA